MTVESDSSSCSQATLAAISLIHDLAEEPELRQLASQNMTLAWPLWAEQQSQGVNGGVKARHTATEPGPRHTGTNPFPASDGTRPGRDQGNGSASHRLNA